MVVNKVYGFCSICALRKIKLNVYLIDKFDFVQLKVFFSFTKFYAHKT